MNRDALSWDATVRSAEPSRFGDGNCRTDLPLQLRVVHNRESIPHQAKDAFMNILEGHTVGIDLGTSYSALAQLDESGRPIVINNSAGSPITGTPSGPCPMATRTSRRDGARSRPGS